MKTDMISLPRKRCPRLTLLSGWTAFQPVGQDILRGAQVERSQCLRVHVALPTLCSDCPDRLRDQGGYNRAATMHKCVGEYTTCASNGSSSTRDAVLYRGYQAPGWLLYKGHRHLHCRIIRWKLHKFHRFAASVGTDRNQGIVCVSATPYLDEARRCCSPGGSSVPSQYTLIVQSPRSLESTHKWSAASVTSSDRCHYVSGS